MSKGIHVALWVATRIGMNDGSLILLFPNSEEAISSDLFLHGVFWYCHPDRERQENVYAQDNVLAMSRAYGETK